MSDLPPVEVSYHRQKSSTGRIRDGKLVLRISTMVSRAEQQKHIQKLTKQLMGSWEKVAQKIPLHFFPALQEGEILLSTGDHYELEQKSAQLQKPKVRKVGQKLIVQVPVSWEETDEEALEEALWRFFAKDQVASAERRLETLREGWLDEQFKQVKFKQVKSRWGSCDKRSKVIMLSVRLLLVDPELFDYVAVHELAHLRYADHSDLFWDCVSQKMPDWKVRRKKLRQYE